MSEEEGRRIGRALIDQYVQSADEAKAVTSREKVEEKLQQKGDYVTLKKLLLTIPKLAQEGDFPEESISGPPDRRPYSEKSPRAEKDRGTGINIMFNRIDGATRGEASNTPEPSRTNATLHGDG